jgi:hypothetical protein
MTLPRIAILLLRGVEGCGVTNYCRHLKAYCDSVSSPCEIFVLNDKKIGREDTSTDLQITKFNFDDRQSIVNRINSDFDLSLVFSVPAKSSSEAVKISYVGEILAKLKSPKWMVNLDHHFLSFSRNADYKNAIEACDGVLCYSLNKTGSGFIGWLEKNGVKTKAQTIDNFFHTPFLNDLISLDREPRKKRIIYAGRAVAWKRGSISLNLHKPLAYRGFISEMIGFERSIAGFTQLNNYEGKLTWFTTEEFYKPIKGPSAFSSSPINTQLFRFLEEKGQDPDLMYVLGSYDYNEGMKRVANSGFAIHPRSFEYNKLCYGNNFEFQGLEAALLSVPIFHRHFLDNVFLPGTNTSLTASGILLSVDDDNTHLKLGGPQVLDVENFCDNLDRIWKSERTYREMREKSVDMVNTYYASSVVVPKILSKLL